MDYNDRIDYSSLSCYLDCPRKFFFKYVLHLRGNQKNINLVFGSAWHYGLELAYSALGEDPTLDAATLRDISIQGFNALWALEGSEFDPDFVFPKSPGHAANMYNKYWARFAPIDTEMTVLAVESPFTVSLSHIDKDLPDYIGRLDLVFQKPDGSLQIVDHKTTKSINSITHTSFECSLQTDGYLTVGHLYYDQVPEMVYSIALCQKSKIEFHRFVINKPKMTIDRFIADLAHHAAGIKKNLLLLDIEDAVNAKRDYHLQAFPRRPGYACTAFFRPCSYYDICKLRANPALWMNNPPSGYSINEWDPAVHEEQLKERLKEAG